MRHCVCSPFHLLLFRMNRYKISFLRLETPPSVISLLFLAGLLLEPRANCSTNTGSPSSYK
ncbi:hypothetical protein M441DRAFT_230892 [Trichoderma asperellum CBS 433.97]|uniref:Uncharacterized protein n=1 Tax=Trichoderma asperellum (strain ATCC 204424 / CBS 433.97 / NBRC 101777) TaxID=1042311 RepID=A0A2T3ZQJ7_TRIA4|nr:hypothetical protein M441DRAFT_230892 [Trichoderma asperellum CBS 433.97]PTB47091.1 hypothetical protein M441DRAFT_230892 [Trichoderma asperellum CBS 433.97]